MVYLTERARELRRRMTEEERILWSQLKNHRKFTAKFRKQHPLGHYIVDFYSKRAKLVVELDGSQHALLKNRIYDAKRTKYLESLGLKVIRYWNFKIRNHLRSVLEEIWETSRERMEERGLKF